MLTQNRGDRKTLPRIRRDGGDEWQRLAVTASTLWWSGPQSGSTTSP
jgi:hypothetical protein